MGHIPGWTIAVNHPHRSEARVRQLMEYLRRNVNGLAGMDISLLFAEAHLAGAFENEINFLLLLVVPRHLPAIWLEQDVPKRKVRGLNGARAAYQILCPSACRISAAGDVFQIRDDHEAPFGRAAFTAAARSEKYRARGS